MKKYNISDHKDEIITDIIKNLIWVPIAAIIPLGNKLINILYSNITDESKYITFSNILIIICMLLSAFSIIFCINIFKKYNKDLTKTESEKNSTDEALFDFRFSSIVAEFTFDDDRRNITSTIDYKMTVLSESVTELKRNLIWSGSEYNGTKLIYMNGDYELVDSDRKHSPYPYTILFNSEKKRGDIIELKTETTVKDGNLDMIPMYSFMAKYQIDTLIIRVIAPKGMIKNVKKSIYADRAKEIVVKKPECINGESIRNLVRYSYKIENPTLFYNYFIEWEFTN